MDAFEHFVRVKLAFLPVPVAIFLVFFVVLFSIRPFFIKAFSRLFTSIAHIETPAKQVKVGESFWFFRSFLRYNAHQLELLSS